jgi:hypothetical protein
MNAEPRRINEIANQGLTSNQRVGSSSLSGRATFHRTKKALQKISGAQLLPSSRIPYFFGFSSAWYTAGRL